MKFPPFIAKLPKSWPFVYFCGEKKKEFAEESAKNWVCKLQIRKSANRKKCWVGKMQILKLPHCGRSLYDKFFKSVNFRI
jgi:hypothetical protein